MRLLLIKFWNTALTIITILLYLRLSCRRSLVPLGGYIVNSLDYCSYSLIGKLTDFFSDSGVHPAQHTSGGIFTFKRTVFLTQLKAKFGSSLTKSAVLRVNLNIDGAPITSRSHTHPSHSQASRLLTSSLSLGVPVPRTTECMRGM